MSGIAHVLAPPTQHRQAAVARDRVEPSLERDLPLVGPQRLVGGREGVLDDVLGLLARAEHVAAECEDPSVMTVVDDLEGAPAAGAYLSDEPLVVRDP